MSGQHALLAPSKSHRFLECAGSLAFQKEAGVPDDETNIYAADGTFSHAIAARILDGAEPQSFLGVTETHDGFTFTCDQERIDRIMVYVNGIRARGGLQFYEQRISMAGVYGVAGQSGTGDGIVIVDGWLESHDFKDGVGPVYAKDNTQCISYALGALDDFAMFGPFKGVRTYIWQPRIDNNTFAEYTMEEVMHWGTRMLDGGQRAYDLWLNATPETIRNNLTPGSQCTYCPMRGRCPAESARVAGLFENLTQAIQVNSTVGLSDEELALWLTREGSIIDALQSFRNEALNRAKVGSKIPGFKLAEGRQGPRKWLVSASSFVEQLLNKALAGDAYDRSLISPTTAEKKLKKAHPATWSELQTSITRSEGALTLVPEADPRQAVTPGTVEFGDVSLPVDSLLS